MKMRNFASFHILFFIVVMIFSADRWPFLMLTVAQLVYVPIALRLVMVKGDWFSRTYMYFALPAYLAVALLQFTSSKWDGVLAGIYLLFTIVIAIYGMRRFLKRGFTHLEEFAIDIGLMYVAMGGGWFFAYIMEIDTGFSPLLTWLTAIHFHYSAFLLPLFIGFLGRFSKHRLYPFICSVLLLSPIIVAIGITFSVWIEVVSVILYIVGLAGLIFIAWTTAFANQLQTWFVRISFSSLGITILFSLLYAVGHRLGIVYITIDRMLLFHGFLNCIVFALLGVAGWALFVPASTFRPPTFPISKIRGTGVIGEKVLEGKCSGTHWGLVDDMRVYEPQIDCKTLSPAIISFYENTLHYKLVAKVQWHRWFKPLAYLYKFVSRNMQQINLPMHRKYEEMTGDLLTLREGIDGRDKVRAWVRKFKDAPAFIALYSEHISDGRTYMNIALPLPFSTMIGVLELNQIGDDLQLTSKKSSSPESDAGTYLAYGKGHTFKLPIEESFIIKEIGAGQLYAQHNMTIFSIPFLTIDYKIHH